MQFMDLQIKTKYHYTPIRIAKIQNTDNTKCWQGCGKQELSLIMVEMQSGAVTLEDRLAVLQD